MKKSNAYYLAQVAVLRDRLLDESQKLPVLRLLMESEDVALYVEREAEKKEQEAINE